MDKWDRREREIAGDDATSRSVKAFQFSKVVNAKKKTSGKA